MPEKTPIGKTLPARRSKSGCAAQIVALEFILRKTRRGLVKARLPDLQTPY
jgi:hypothetical protein